MLTDAECRSALCPAGKSRARLFDSEGLYLEISPTGSKRKYEVSADESSRTWFVADHAPGMLG